MVWEADHTVVCDGCQWVMQQPVGGLKSKENKQPLIDAGGHIVKRSYRAYCPMCLLDATSDDVQTTDPHFQYKSRAQRREQKTLYWRRPSAEESPVSEPSVETRTDPLPPTCKWQNQNLAESSAADSWAGVTEWADGGGPAGQADTSYMQVAAAPTMCALPPEAHRIACQPTLSEDIGKAGMSTYSDTVTADPFTDPRLSAAACEVVNKLGDIHETMKEIKNLLETLVKRLPRRLPDP
jgi:hypothetical protein